MSICLTVRTVFSLPLSIQSMQENFSYAFFPFKSWYLKFTCFICVPNVLLGSLQLRLASSHFEICNQ